VRKGLPLLAAVAFAALLAVPATATNGTVRATPSDTFAPARIAVKPGESVTFTNSGGFHDVVFNGERQPQIPDAGPSAEAWSGTRTFTARGVYRYYCTIHAEPQGTAGMVGYVYVNPAGTLPPVLSRVSVRGATSAAIVRFTSSAPGTTTAAIFRGGRTRPMSTFRFAAHTGYNYKRLGRRFARGTYRLQLSVAGAGGRSNPVKRTFTVRS
jgi:plastocyanin